MQRRDLIKKLALLPLMGNLGFKETQLPPNLNKAQKNRLIIDTHVETWNFDERFPFKHPENPNLKVSIEAPIENQIKQMADYGLRYGVLINPRYYGWDNSYMANCLKT